MNRVTSRLCSKQCLAVFSTSHPSTVALVHYSLVPSRPTAPSFPHPLFFINKILDRPLAFFFKSVQSPLSQNDDIYLPDTLQFRKQLTAASVEAKPKLLQ